MSIVGSKQSYAESAIILNTNPKTVERTILALCKKKVETSSRYAQVKRLGIDEQSHQEVLYLCANRFGDWHHCGYLKKP